MSKHTPGPWVEVDTNRDVNTEIQGAGGKSVIDCSCCCCGGGVCFDNEADKTLVLAAPDLLEALKALNECPYVIDQDTVPRGKQPHEAPDQVVMTLHIGGRIYANMRAAIAKAEGQASAKHEAALP